MERNSFGAASGGGTEALSHDSYIFSYLG